MIQVTVTPADGEGPTSAPIDVAPVSSGERAPFLRDRTLGETSDLVSSLVRRGDWIMGEYKVYRDGNYLGSMTPLGPPKFEAGDIVCPAEMYDDRKMVLVDARKRGYHPNKGRVVTRRAMAREYRYEVDFPGAENVGIERLDMGESELREWE